MGFMDFVATLNNIVWGLPLIVLLLFTGLYFTARTGFFQFKHFGWIINKTIKSARKEAKGKGTISSLQAMMTSVGATVGTGDIGGVGVAIAVGGPGALFWIWVVAFLGMVTKMVEVSLALHYRKKDDLGERYVGGPTFYMQYGLGEEKGWGKYYKILAVLFGFGILLSIVFTLTCFNVADGIHASIPNISRSAVSIVYGICVVIVLAGGFKRVANVAEKIVPFMCAGYIMCALLIVVFNIDRFPTVMAEIFKGAFTGTAAVGGFTGATVRQVIKTGAQRSLYTNEAGWGTSPMIHASATVKHPVEQGIWSALDVFVDTIIVSNVTGLAILFAGVWDSGKTGAALTLSAFEKGLGPAASVVLSLALFFFGFTTTTGSYVHFDTIIRHAFGDSKLGKFFVKFIKYAVPIPPVVTVLLADRFDVIGSEIWGLVDLATGIPTFANLIAILLLGGKFIALFKDYKAKYMGEGEVDPKFKPWYNENAQ